MLALVVSSFFTTFSAMEGEYSAARRTFERLLTAKMTLLGPTHQNTLRTRVNIASACISMHDHPKARHHLELAVDGFMATIGPENLETVLAKVCLTCFILNAIRSTPVEPYNH